jgi:uncharacterized membrane protein YhaH (DUF805 family)
MTHRSPLAPVESSTGPANATRSRVRQTPNFLACRRKETDPVVRLSSDFIPEHNSGQIGQGEFMSYLFSFRGRINRAKLWLFFLVVIAWEILLLAIAAVGFDWTGFFESLNTAAANGTPQMPIDFGSLAWPRLNSARAMISLGVIALLVFAYLWAHLAVYTKRLHDRNKSAWWLVPYMLVPILLHTYTRVSGHSFFAPMQGHSTPSGIVAYAVATLIGLWVFVELFFFRGTAGENRFGPDPLA